jgi:hypothetical protein
VNLLNLNLLNPLLGSWLKPIDFYSASEHITTKPEVAGLLVAVRSTDTERRSS